MLKVPIVYQGFEGVGRIVKQFISFSDEGAKFVFGNLYDARPPDKGGTWSVLFGTNYLFQFAFVALPPILFVSAFFTMLYHFGILQRLVRLLAVVMVYLMRTSGAETLSVSANVFMGQTEAPLIVKPYVPRMTNSELFALMASGMAHISGGMMVVYINYGADPVAVLTTCVMACPCSLYLSKLFLPELSVPVTAGTVHTKKEKSPYVNAIDAIAAGTQDGLRLALNVAAMLIVFIAFVAMIDALLGEHQARSAQFGSVGRVVELVGRRAFARQDIWLAVFARRVLDGRCSRRHAQSGRAARIEAVDQRAFCLPADEMRGRRFPIS